MRTVPHHGKTSLTIVASTLLAMSCAETSGDPDQIASTAPLAAAAATTTYEAESLARTASAVGSKVTSDAAASGGKFVEFNGTAAAGAWIELTLPNVAAGTYDLGFLYKSNNNRGIVQASVDGVNQGATCNEYAATVAYKVACSLGRKTLTAGNHTIRFTLTSKSASSSGYQMVLDQLSATAAAVAPAPGPCDVYAAGNTPCVAAYSTVRVLSSSYTGPLYQVRKGAGLQNTGTGGTTQDIGSKDGFGDAAAQDAFCGTDTCTVSRLYDQSGRGNHLKVAPKGLSSGGTFAAMDDFESDAKKGPITVGGHKVYSLYMNTREGYRLTAVGAGMPRGTAAQGIYMLGSGTHSGTACCFDFGNVSTDPMIYHTMNALFLGTAFWGRGSGTGPWFMADFEAGVWAGGSGTANALNANNPSVKLPYAFGILNTSPGQYVLKSANGQSGALTISYDGAAPKAMDNQGGIVLGVASDNSNNSFGTFFEGAITAGRPSDATDAAVLANVQAIGYGL